MQYIHICIYLVILFAKYEAKTYFNILQINRIQIGKNLAQCESTPSLTPYHRP